VKRAFKWDKKYLYWGITAFCVVACAILFYMALNYISSVGLAIKGIFKILSPFVWGLVITWLLNPVMKIMERKLFLPLTGKLYSRSKKSGKSLARGLSVLFSEIILLACLTALVYLIIPQLYQSLEKIVRSSDEYISTITRWVEKFLRDYPQIEAFAMDALGGMNESLMEWLKTKALPSLGSLVTNVTAGVYYVLVGIYNLIIGIIVSVYLMSNLEHFTASAKRWLYSSFSVSTAKKIIDGLRFTDRTFIGFLNGKVLDSAIIGLICYVVCALLDMPYALLVSVIIGVTNIIPFFGPFIGAVPSALIILLVSPLKCLIFVIFIIILQQLDGNVIGPKILGSSIGINGFWVMFSIILGAGLFGFWGMLLGVPVFVVIYTVVNNLIEKKLRREDLPWENEDYVDMDYIDPATHEIVKKKGRNSDREKAEEEKAAPQEDKKDE
jgi:predicted PurR-regulated permease PerM